MTFMYTERDLQMGNTKTKLGRDIPGIALPNPSDSATLTKDRQLSSDCKHEGCLLHKIKPLIQVSMFLGMHATCVKENSHLKDVSPTVEKQGQFKGCCTLRSKGLPWTLHFFVVLLICSYGTYWACSQVGTFISQFFHGVEFYLYSGFLSLSYVSCVGLYLSTWFSFRKLPEIWWEISSLHENIRHVVHGCDKIVTDDLTPKFLGRRLKRSCWFFMGVTIAQSLAYMTFMQFAVRKMCNLMLNFEEFRMGGGCWGQFGTTIGLNTILIEFFFVNFSPQMVSILFFAHCVALTNMLKTIHAGVSVSLQNLANGVNIDSVSDMLAISRKNYLQLLAITRKIGNCFGWQLFLIFGGSISSMTVAMYILFLMVESFRASGPEGAPITVLLGTQLYFATYSLTFVFAGGTMVKNAGAEINEEIRKVVLPKNFKENPAIGNDVRFEIDLLTKLEMPIVRAFGMLTIEMQTLCTVIANVITYFLILIQVKISFELSYQGPTIIGENQTSYSSV